MKSNGGTIFEQMLRHWPKPLFVAAGLIFGGFVSMEVSEVHSEHKNETSVPAPARTWLKRLNPPEVRMRSAEISAELIRRGIHVVHPREPFDEKGVSKDFAKLYGIPLNRLSGFNRKLAKIEKDALNKRVENSRPVISGSSFLVVSTADPYTDAKLRQDFQALVEHTLGAEITQGIMQSHFGLDWMEHHTGSIGIEDLSYDIQLNPDSILPLYTSVITRVINEEAEPRPRVSIRHFRDPDDLSDPLDHQMVVTHWADFLKHANSQVWL